MKIDLLKKNRIMFGLLAIIFVVVTMNPNSVKAENDVSAEETLESQTAEETPDKSTEAIRLKAEFEVPEGVFDSDLQDGKFEKAVLFRSNTSLKLKTKEKTTFLYIIWDVQFPPNEWTLKVNETELKCGTEGFLHEFVELPEGCNECELIFNDPTGICEIYAFGEGDIPKSVQIWKKIKKDADFLFFVPHSGDEIIDFGAAIATYSANKDINLQVVYMCEYATTEEPIKEHEKLNSLWDMGVTYYPICGQFRNKRLTDLKKAEMFYGYEKVLSFVTETIRKYRPLIVVGPDFYGEYGNGAHILLANAVSEAVKNSSDKEFFEESAIKYGNWDVPKTYIHNLRYKEEGTIDLGYENGLAELIGNAYDNRLTDTQCSTHITTARVKLDQSGCFGLFRSIVGVDELGEMTENVVLYAEQARRAEEEAERIRIEEYQRQNIAYDRSLRDTAKVGLAIYGRCMSGDLGKLLKIKANEWE